MLVLLSLQMIASFDVDLSLCESSHDALVNACSHSIAGDGVVDYNNFCADSECHALLVNVSFHCQYSSCNSTLNAYANAADAKLLACTPCNSAKAAAVSHCHGSSLNETDSCYKPACAAALSAKFSVCDGSDRDDASDMLDQCPLPMLSPLAALDEALSLRRNFRSLIRETLIEMGEMWANATEHEPLGGPSAGISNCPAAPVIFMGRHFADKDSCRDWCEASGVSMNFTCTPATCSSSKDACPDCDHHTSSCSDACDTCPEHCANCGSHTSGGHDLCPASEKYEMVWVSSDGTMIEKHKKPDGGCVDGAPISFHQSGGEVCPFSSGGERGASRGAVFNTTIAHRIEWPEGARPYEWERLTLYAGTTADPNVTLTNRLLRSHGFFRANNSGSFVLQDTATDMLMFEPNNRGSFILNGSKHTQVLVIDPMNAPAADEALLFLGGAATVVGGVNLGPGPISFRTRERIIVADILNSGTVEFVGGQQTYLLRAHNLPGGNVTFQNAGGWIYECHNEGSIVASDSTGVLQGAVNKAGGTIEATDVTATLSNCSNEAGAQITVARGSYTFSGLMVNRGIIRVGQPPSVSRRRRALSGTPDTTVVIEGGSNLGTIHLHAGVSVNITLDVNEGSIHVDEATSGTIVLKSGGGLINGNASTLSVTYAMSPSSLPPPAPPPPVVPSTPKAGNQSPLASAPVSPPPLSHAPSIGKGLSPAALGGIIGGSTGFLLVVLLALLVLARTVRSRSAASLGTDKKPNRTTNSSVTLNVSTSERTKPAAPARVKFQPVV